MKRIISAILTIALLSGLVLSLIACNKTPREEILKLYMPGEYIDEEIFGEFESWYEENYGKKVTVQLETFDAVEDIQLAVEGSQADYDLLCPSDYMVEYLIKQNLLLESGMDISGGLFKDQYVATTREFDPSLKYAVPYMYGTLGLVYDYSKTQEKITSWESFFGSKYNNNRSVKDSIRDAYAAACIYNAGSTIKSKSGAERKAAIQAVFMDTSVATVNSAKSTLLSIKDGSVWDVDNVKYEMASKQDNAPAIALMWSCDAGYVMNDYEDEDGNDCKGNRDLWYVVPEEGGNVYIDAFVISKYAKNVDAARAFLQFICQTEIAVKNSEYAGAISPVAEAYDELHTYYTEDEDGMFTQALIDSGWKDMFIETMFPSEETLCRCGVMKDFGAEGKTRVTEMWSAIQ